MPLLKGMKILTDFLDLARPDPDKDKVIAFIKRHGGEAVEVMEEDVKMVVSSHPWAKLPWKSQSKTKAPNVLRKAYIHKRPIYTPAAFFESAKRAGKETEAPTKASASALKDFHHSNWFKFQDSDGKYAPVSASFAQWPPIKVHHEFGNDGRNEVENQEQPQPSSQEKETNSSDIAIVAEFEADREQFCHICVVELESAAELNAHEESDKHRACLRKEYATFSRLLNPVPFPPPSPDYPPHSPHPPLPEQQAHKESLSPPREHTESKGEAQNGPVPLQQDAAILPSIHSSPVPGIKTSPKEVKLAATAMLVNESTELRMEAGKTPERKDPRSVDVCQAQTTPKTPSLPEEASKENDCIPVTQESLTESEDGRAWERGESVELFDSSPIRAECSIVSSAFNDEEDRAGKVPKLRIRLLRTKPRVNNWKRELRFLKMSRELMLKQKVADLRRERRALRKGQGYQRVLERLENRPQRPTHPVRLLYFNEMEKAMGWAEEEDEMEVEY